MRLGYSQVEGLLARLNHISADRREAFRGRLKHFQRSGFPAESKTGKGKPAAYTLRGMTQLVLAIEMTQVGLVPVKATDLVTHSWEAFEFAMGYAYQTIIQDADISDHWLMIMSVEAMRELTGPLSNKYDNYDAVTTIRASEFSDFLRGDGEPTIGERYRLVILDATELARTILGEMIRAGLTSPDCSEVGAEISEWWAARKANHEQLMIIAGELDLGRRNGDDTKA